MATKIAEAYVVLRAAADQLASDMAIGRQAVLQGVTDIGNTITTTFSNVGSSVGGPLGDAISYVGTIANRVAGEIRVVLGGAFGAATVAAQGLAATAADIISSTMKGTIASVIGLFTTTWKSLEGSIISVMEGLKPVISGVLSVFTGLFSIFSNAVVGLFQTAFNTVMSIVQGVLTAVAHAITSIIQTALELTSALVTKAAEIVSGFASRLGGAILGPAMSSFKAGLTDFEHWTTAAIDAESATMRLAAMIKGTGEAAGWSAAQMDVMARNMADAWALPVGSVREMQLALVRFTEITGKTFTESMNAARQLSVIIGRDVGSAALQLGRAMENPQHGMRLLMQAGVMLTPIQHEMVKLAVETNNLGYAQQLVLSLIDKFGDVAGASLDTTAGRVQRLSATWSNFGVSIGQSLKPLADIVLNFLQPLVEGFAATFGIALDGIAGNSKSLAAQASAWIKENTNLIRAWGSTIAATVKGVYDFAVSVATAAGSALLSVIGRLTTEGSSGSDSLADRVTSALATINAAANNIPLVWDIISHKIEITWLKMLDKMKNELFKMFADIKMAAPFLTSVFIRDSFGSSTGALANTRTLEQELDDLKKEFADKQKDAEERINELKRNPARRREVAELENPTPRAAAKIPPEFEAEMKRLLAAAGGHREESSRTVGLEQMWKGIQESLTKPDKYAKDTAEATKKSADFLEKMLNWFKEQHPNPAMAAP